MVPAQPVPHAESDRGDADVRHQGRIIPAQPVPPDDTVPSSERQAELHTAYAENNVQGRPPYWHVHLRTRGEFNWIMQQRGWDGNFDDFNLAEQFARDHYFTTADLRDVNLSFAVLPGIKLNSANLANAILLEADLAGAQFVDADLSDARLRKADCSGANFQNATMIRTHCRRTNFSQANLTFASLQSARFSVADLRGARMVGVHLDASTILSEALFDQHTELGDIIWNDALLTRVEWEQVQRLGDEAFNLGRAKNRTQRIVALRNAARAYKGLAALLKSQGVAIPAARFRLRAQRLERQAIRLEHKYLNWLGSVILDAVAGYGERPGRSFGAYLLVVAGFASAYYGIGMLHGPALSPLGALIFSLTSFHGRGFFPGTLTTIDGPFPLLAAMEAVTGLFIELIFIATFSRRFLGD